jgi:NADP-dependent 3-hydroxy acid dehydrogenase YdfG
MTGTGRGAALVVGAGSAIGRAVAGRLADEGFALHLWGRDPDRLADAATACVRPDRPAPVTAVVDVTAPDQPRRAAVALGSDPAAGRDAVDLRAVVWAAGVFDWAPADEADPATWRRLLDVNLGAAAELVALVAPTLVAHAPASLVLGGATAAHRVFPHNAAYVASKHGLAALAEATWLDLRGKHVGVTRVSPGAVAAGATLDSPAAAFPERLLTADDVAAAVGYAVGTATSVGGRGCPTVLRLEPYLDH